MNDIKDILDKLKTLPTDSATKAKLNKPEHNKTISGLLQKYTKEKITPAYVKTQSNK